ncbi:hypothetical protein TWF506_005921 [Arthrobotrys conoides]|uniref:Uncharacterized protein n=1 Tax=Arthrobotrys conoides TaxID=74498 RepID=A0AAN8S3Y2_9PEZI
MSHPHFLGLPLEIRIEIYGYLLPIKPDPESPIFSPQSPTYSPTSPNFSPISPVYSPASPRFSRYVPTTPSAPLVADSLEANPALLAEASTSSAPPTLPTNSAAIVETQAPSIPVDPPLDDSTPKSHPTESSPMDPSSPNDGGTTPIQSPIESPGVNSPSVPRTPTSSRQQLKLKLPGDQSLPNSEDHEFSILYVNKQIHSEVRVFLYRRHPIKITIDLNGTTSNKGTKASFEVVYTSPWESLEYKHVVDLAADTRQKYYVGRRPRPVDVGLSPIISNEEYLRLQQPGVINTPRPEYRQFIRRVQIKVTEGRESNNPYRNKDLKDLNDSIAVDYRLLLLPFLWRLREVLNESTIVDINVSTTGGKYWEGMWEDDDDDERWKESHQRTIETVYLLTRGPWKSTMNLIPSPGCDFPWLKQEVLSKCEEYPEFQETAIEEALRELKVDMPEGSWWGYRYRKLWDRDYRKLMLFDPNFEPPSSPVFRWQDGVVVSPVYDAPWRFRRHNNPDCTCS